MQPHFESGASLGCGVGSSAAPGAAHSVRAGPSAAPPHRTRAHRHNRRFSSSQAHLQSLAGLQPVERGGPLEGSLTLGRKPSSGRAETRTTGSLAASTSQLNLVQQAPPPVGPSQQAPSRGGCQLRSSLAAPTKPMTASTDEAPSSSARRQQLFRAQQVPVAQPLPPPYQAAGAPVPLVVCQQPTGGGQASHQVPIQLQQAGGSAAVAAALLAAQQQQQQQHRSSNLSGGATAGSFVPTSAASLQLAPGAKQKSCLACADISIKWYIVVIALLGLICALIGTIVGAVHSVGRDYFSLALLLLGKSNAARASSLLCLQMQIELHLTGRAGGLSAIWPKGR